MTQRSKSLRVGIAEQKEQYRDRENDRPRLGEKQQGGHDESHAGQESKQGHGFHRHQTGRDMPTLCAGIVGINLTVCESIEGHSRRACEDHAEQDAQQFPPAEFGNPPREDGRKERERERKKSVAEPDEGEELLKLLKGVLRRTEIYRKIALG